MTSLTGTTTYRPQGRANCTIQSAKHRCPEKIEDRFEDRIEEHSEDVQLKNPSWTRRTTAGQALSDQRCSRIRVHARTEVFLALCLRLIVAITNYERGNEPGCEKL